MLRRTRRTACRTCRSSDELLQAQGTAGKWAQYTETSPSPMARIAECSTMTMIHFARRSTFVSVSLNVNGKVPL